MFTATTAIEVLTRKAREVITWLLPLEVEMIKQLRKVGNSNALILDKPILELLGLEENGQVQLTIEDGVLIVAPANPRQLTPEGLQDHLDYIVQKRQSALKRLAQ